MATTTVRGGTSIKGWPGWDYVPGIAFLMVGILAVIEPPIASFATAIYLGFMLCVAGGFALAAGIANLSRRGAWLSILLGLLTLAVGIMVLYNPVVGAVSLIWLLGAWLLVGGVFQLAMGFSVPVGKTWLILAGIVDLALGALVVTMQPGRAFAFLGLFVGISFILRGLWSLVFTADLHRAEHLA
jgi:uncharacterized membrane protein HdeD (DUF308 family)